MSTHEKYAPKRVAENKKRGGRWLWIVLLCVVTILGIWIAMTPGNVPQEEPDPVPDASVTDEPQTPEPEPEPEPEPVPEILTLVNPWNQVPENWSVELMTLPNGLEIDRRCYDALMEMIGDCSAAGLTPVICSAYRTQSFQELLFNNKVAEWANQGYGPEEAREKAGRQVAVPGTSEHQLGLAVDIVDISYQLLDNNQENTAVQKWLMENSWKYGFILRYPTSKTDITGIVYEPWHYRYVSKEYAQDIYESGQCLEEYLESWGTP